MHPDPRKLRDAKRLSEPEYFIKYGEHPGLVLKQADDEEGEGCLSCQ